ncbi:MAG: hypothetical protein K2N64_05130 [Anaeroplasmataceae bacterium]|nr:hypothetical protein [Anaeroplasmataceae bacterium]
MKQGFASLVKENNELQNIEKISEMDKLLAVVEDEMFAQNCVAVIGPCMNEYLMNFRSGIGNTVYEKWESLAQQGKPILENKLHEEISVSVIPSKIKELVKLPFSAYITTDEYSNICNAISDLGSRAFIVKPESSRSFDIQHGDVPVFLLNRSSKEKDDCVGLDSESEVLLRILLSGRRLIYLGFNKDYQGYKEIGKYLRGLLGDDYFTSTINIAFVPNDDMQFESIYNDEENRMKIVNLSSDRFLDKIISSSELLKKIFSMNQSDNHFVTELFNMASTPTETQAVELLINQLQSDISAGLDITIIIDKYDRNVSALKMLKPNFNAFVKCWIAIKTNLLSGQTRRQFLERIVREEKRKREDISEGIQNNGSILLSSSSIKEYKNILLFSQSLRVAEFLFGADDSFLRESNIYICECRPKSETPFRDAMDMGERLCNGLVASHHITIIPDMAAFNLLSRGLIDLVILGAHDVVFYKERPISFINTCGSAAIMSIAKQFQISVIVVAESGKFTEATYNSIEKQYEYAISYGHESTIYKDFNFALWAKKMNIQTRNIGYDYCLFYKGVKLVSENQIFDCNDEKIDVKLIDETL